MYFPIEFKDKRLELDIDKIEMKEIEDAKENLQKLFKFNLADLVSLEFDVFAPRFRISSMKVLLLDENQQILYHHSDDENDETIHIKFPKIFYDRDINRKKLQFRMEEAHSCLSSYYNKSENIQLLLIFWSWQFRWFLGGEPFFSEFCNVPSDFSNDAYQPSIDGFYEFNVDSDRWMEETKYFRVFISGSYVDPK